jgi:MFS family permease
MVRATEAGLLLSSAGLALNALAAHPRVWVLFCAAALMAALDGLQRPSLEALVPRLVPRDELPGAAALQSLRGNVGQLAGPALGGLLIAGAGLPVAYLVDTASFAVSLLVLGLLRAAPPPPEAERPSLRGIADGLRYARGRQDLLGTYLVDVVAMLFGMPMALFPAIALRFGGARTLGLLYAAPAAGALLISAASGWIGRVHRHGLAILLAAAAWGAAIVGFGLAAPLWLALAMLAAAGAADMVSGKFRTINKGQAFYLALSVYTVLPEPFPDVAPAPPEGSSRQPDVWRPGAVGDPAVDRADADAQRLRQLNPVEHVVIVVGLALHVSSVLRLLIRGR